MNLQQVCQQLPPWAHVGLWVVVLLWEYVLGKTKFGSTVSLFVETPLTKISNLVQHGTLNEPLPVSKVVDLKPPKLP